MIYPLAGIPTFQGVLLGRPSSPSLCALHEYPVLVSSADSPFALSTFRRGVVQAIRFTPTTLREDEVLLGRFLREGSEL